MYLSPRLTQSITRYVDKNVAAVLARVENMSACAGIPPKPGPRSRKSNAAEAQKARINHHGTYKIPARRFIFAPVGGYGEDIVPPDFYRELRETIKNLFERGTENKNVPYRRKELARNRTPTGVVIDVKYVDDFIHRRSMAFSSRDDSGFVGDKLTGHQVMLQIAEKMAELQKSYIEGRFVAPNAESTIRQKKSKKVTPPDLPLVEKGKMKNAIKGWVE